MNPVVHFEMPYKAAKRASKFYKVAFGWGMDDAGADMGHYVLATTSATDKKRMVKAPGTINGGFYKWSKASKEPSVVISVADLKKSMAQVKGAGGKILGKPQQIPGIGLWVSLRDTEGNKVSILQPRR
jgi:predicted enzyme related to lactoylglutathione lyase